jgi:cobyrinic acid a,c-diamide synthase
VQTFKKGPDYIDPLWLSVAAGRPCYNLDFFLSPDGELRDQFARHGHDADVCLVEGNKGLYDGLDLEGSNSNAALARLLDLPVVLVLDARGMTRGIAPLILGYQAFDRNIRIAGVILNRLGGRRHEAKLRAVIEHYTDVPVIGAVQEDAELALVERHLGLMPANETAEAERHIAAIGQRIAARSTWAPAGHQPHRRPCRAAPPRPEPGRAGAHRHRARRRLRLLLRRRPRRPGRGRRQTVFFDTLKDPQLPPCDGLLIGGGFPECFLDGLEANASLRADIRRAIEAGLPTYAECGGLMYLARGIEWKGRRAAMVGAIPGDIRMHAKPVGRGYVILEAGADHPWRAPTSAWQAPSCTPTSSTTPSLTACPPTRATPTPCAAATASTATTTASCCTACLPPTPTCAPPPAATGRRSSCSTSALQESRLEGIQPCSL